MLDIIGPIIVGVCLFLIIYGVLQIFKISEHNNEPKQPVHIHEWDQWVIYLEDWQRRSCKTCGYTEEESI